MDLEKMKQKFKDHKATFTDYGNIKILDLRNQTVQSIESDFFLKKTIADYTFQAI